MTDIFTNNCYIQIRLTRNDNPEEDDRIMIRYKDENIYQIFFRDGHLKSKSTFITVLTGEELDTYIESLFTLLVRDTDPFKAINFLLPCFPVVQFDIEDLRGGKLRKALKRILPILYSAAKY